MTQPARTQTFREAFLLEALMMLPEPMPLEDVVRLFAPWAETVAHLGTEYVASAPMRDDPAQ